MKRKLIDMPFVTLPGFEGRIYVPRHAPDCPRKHACQNCYACQMCSDDRCALCLAEEACCPEDEGRDGDG